MRQPDAANDLPGHGQQLAGTGNLHDLEGFRRLPGVIGHRKRVGENASRRVVMGHNRPQNDWAAVAEVPSVAGDAVVVAGEIRVEGQFNARLAVGRTVDDGHGRRASNGFDDDAGGIGLERMVHHFQCHRPPGQTGTVTSCSG